MPQNIIMINGTATKFNHIKQFIAKNKLETEVKHVANSSFGLISNTATKQVFLDPLLQKAIAPQKVQSFEGVDVCRVTARVGISDD